MKLSLTGFFLSAALTGTFLSSLGCSLMNVPSNLLNGLQRTDVSAATAAQQEAVVAEEVSPSVKELSEIRDLLRKMVKDGELTENQAALKFLQEKSRLMTQDQQRQDFAAAQEQQRDLANRQMLQQFMNKGLNCHTNLGQTFCY
jgi:hypothetical protein